jgi:hypothetical protein
MTYRPDLSIPLISLKETLMYRICWIGFKTKLGRLERLMRRLLKRRKIKILIGKIFKINQQLSLEKLYKRSIQTK